MQKEPLEPSYMAIEKFISILDTQQLRTELIHPSVLKKELDVLSGNIMNEKYIGSDGKLLVHNLIKQLKCSESQNIKTLHLDENRIYTEDAILLAKALSKNILPYLEILDLSNNFIEHGALKAFYPLLIRSNFERLILCKNEIETNEVHKVFTSPYVLGKLIWISKNAVQTEWDGKQISQLEYEAHKSFY